MPGNLKILSVFLDDLFVSLSVCASANFGISTFHLLFAADATQPDLGTPDGPTNRPLFLHVSYRESINRVVTTLFIRGQRENSVKVGSVPLLCY